MPPVSFFEAQVGSWDSGTSELEVVTPTRTRAGDVLLAVVAAEDAAVDIDTDWEVLAHHTAGTVNTAVWLLRRVAVEAEPGVHVFTMSSSPADPVRGAILLYRGLDPGAALVDTGQVEDTSAGTAFVAPSVTLATYSDLLVTAYFTTSVAMAWGPAPAGMTERVDNDRLAVYDQLVGATGATGTRTGTAGVASTGVGISFAIAAAPLQPARVLSASPPGAIGLPEVGI